MASVSRPRDRGQLILVTGLTIAVILVMLVLLLNTVIYTENLATRGIDSGGGDAVEYRATVVGSVGELIERENERYDESYPPEEGVEVGIEETNGMLSERYLYRGTIAEARSDQIAVDEASPRIWQHESEEVREFTSAGEDPDADWEVMTETNEFERFVMTVDPDEFEEDSEPFRIEVGDWSMEIDVEFENGSEDQITVAIDEEEPTYEYDYEEAPLEIDFVVGSIETDGESEDDIDAPEPNGGELWYKNGDQATGTFDLRADGTAAEDNLTAYDGGDEEDPYYTYPVESVDLTLHYETSELRFVTQETITAEEGEEES